MYEVDPGYDRRHRLIDILGADFTSDQSRSYAAEADQTGSALAGLLSVAREAEDVGASFASPENRRLGEEVLQLIGPAPITRSFASYIADEVRAAHAWQRRVSEDVSPTRLGLEQGEGIFETRTAKKIEAEALQRFFSEMMAARPRALMLGDRRGPAQDAARFGAWNSDYFHLYGEHAVENPDGHSRQVEGLDLSDEQAPSDWTSFVGAVIDRQVDRSRRPPRLPPNPSTRLFRRLMKRLAERVD
jgi:hypothetical protein